MCFNYTAPMSEDAYCPEKIGDGELAGYGFVVESPGRRGSSGHAHPVLVRHMPILGCPTPDLSRVWSDNLLSRLPSGIHR